MNMNIHYDEEGDYLEINLGNPKKGHFIEVEEGIFHRVDDKTNEVLGVAISGFRKRTKDSTLNFPITASH